MILTSWSKCNKILLHGFSCDYSDKEKRRRKIVADKTVEDESEVISGKELFRTATVLNIIRWIRNEITENVGFLRI